MLFQKEYAYKICDAITYCRTQKNEEYTAVNIKNQNAFDSFCFGINSDGRIYSHCDFSVPDDGYKNLNCSSTELIKTQLEQIQNDLENNFGIITDITNAKYTYLEVNKTILLDNEFSMYFRALKLMFLSFPKKLRLKTDYVGGSHSNIDINNDPDSFITTSGKSSDKIKKQFKTNCVWDIDDIIINTFFDEFINKNLVEAYKKTYIKRRESILKILKQNYIPNSRTWVHNCLIAIYEKERNNNLCPLMLDISELLPLLNLLQFSNKQAKSRAKMHFLAMRNKCSSFFACDDKKYEELIKKLI